MAIKKPFRLREGRVRRSLGWLWLVVVLSMMLAGCGKPRPPAAILQPLPGATLFREEIACDPAINAAMFDLMQVLRKEFGTLSIERYSVPPDADFARIADHYRRQLPANWQAGSYPTDTQPTG